MPTVVEKYYQSREKQLRDDFKDLNGSAVKKRPSVAESSAVGMEVPN